MAAYLLITVRFLAERYHGALWPPAPATLFQALVSGGNTGAAGLDWGEASANALSWLESLSPPVIAARQPPKGAAYRIFVPTNHMDKAAQSEASNSAKPVKPESLRAAKPISPRLLHPVQSHGQASVIYAWELPEPGDPQIPTHTATLDALAARLTALGWGLDFAAAQVEISSALPEQSPAWEHFVPSPNGAITLQVPAPGLLRSLDRRFATFRSRISADGLNPTLPPAEYREVPYRSTSQPEKPLVIPFDLRIAPDKWLTKPWAQSMHASGWLRHAAAEALAEEEFPEDFVNAFASGHTPAGDRGHRLSYLPLPSIGAHHTDGLVRRVLLAAPQNLQPLERAALSLLRLKLAGAPIFEENNPSPSGYFDRPEDSKSVYEWYLQTATVWQSVTPVILPGFNLNRGKLCLKRTQRLLLQSLATAGYPEESIAALEYQPSPYWPGASAANRIFVPGHLQRWPRLHVRVEFTRPVSGPVSIGLGRHFGIGLLAAPRS